MKPENQLVLSKDGTRITYLIYGIKKPGLILIPGALSIAKDFEKLAKELSTNFTVYAINRRGREGSGPQGEDYSIEKEIEDIEAVRKATGAIYVFGHSFGGFLALEFAAQYKHMQKTVVYEPGVSVDNSISMEWAAECESYLNNNMPLDAFVTFVRAMNPDSAKAPRRLLKFMISLFVRGEERRRKFSLLQDTIKEHAEEARLDNTYPKYVNITASVLLLRGGANNVTTPAFEKLRLLPNVKTHIWQKFDHFGAEKHPKEVAAAIANFIL